MEYIITELELRVIMAKEIFEQTGAAVRPDELDIHFINNGNSTRVDEIKIRRKE